MLAGVIALWWTAARWAEEGWRAYTNELETRQELLETLRDNHEQELTLANRIYETHARPNIPEAIENLSYASQPMAVLNGDVVMASETPSGHQLFLLGDFTGHGLPAAVGAMVVFDVFYAMSSKGFALADIVRELNIKLRATLPTGRFMATCAVEINSTGDRATVWNAGLPQLLHRSPSAGLKETLPSEHLPLGIVDEEQLDLNGVHVDLEENDELILCSDGVVEAADSAGGHFGLQRLMRTAAGIESNADTLDTLLMAMTAFRGDAPPTDDVSVMVIRAKHTPMLDG